ncbi:MAG: NUDIX hydrolase [Candidatus Moraniibacteriota bacterium]
MLNKIEKWEEISREEIFSKYGRGIERVDFKLPNGEVSDFYIKKESVFVATLAITKDEKIILVKQFRPGPKEILTELPGGYVDKGETPKQAGERELLEETGYTGDVEFVTSIIGDGYSTMEKNCVVATNCKKISEQKLEENEFTEVVLMSITEFRELLRSGKSSDVEVGYLGLDYLGLL